MNGEDDIKKSPHKTTLVLKVPSQKTEKEPSDILKKGQYDIANNEAVAKIKEKLLAALRIISIATFEDDIFDEFFSSFSNYISIANKLDEMRILSKDVVMDEESFNKNPPDCWMKLIMVIFVALYTFPDKSNIYCDVITSSKVENDAERTPLGIYFSMILRLEVYDWNDHKIDLYIPNRNGERMLFLIDDEPVLYTFVTTKATK